jgi:queuine tRNA-ribosyltransferase
LVRAEPATAAKLLTVHNLAFLERLVAGAREAIAADAFAVYRDAILGGSGEFLSHVGE